MGLRCNVWLVGLACFLAPSLYAYRDAPDSVTLSVQVGGRPLLSEDIAFTAKKGYVLVLFNAAPYLADIKGGKDGLKPVVKMLLENLALSKFLKTKLFKIDVVDIAARDDYGLPIWEKVKLIERFTASRGRKGLEIKAGDGH